MTVSRTKSPFPAPMSDGDSPARYHQDETRLQDAGPARNREARSYMHDGPIATLEQVVEHYDTEASTGRAARPRKPLGLTAQEKSETVAFLKTLTAISIRPPCRSPSLNRSTQPQNINAQANFSLFCRSRWPVAGASPPNLTITQKGRVFSAESAASRRASADVRERRQRASQHHSTSKGNEFNLGSQPPAQQRMLLSRSRRGGK